MREDLPRGTFLAGCDFYARSGAKSPSLALSLRNIRHDTCNLRFVHNYLNFLTPLTMENESF